MTRIVSNLENNRSFLMKSIEMEFHGHLGIESCLRSGKLVMLWLRSYTSDIELTELLYISMEVGPGIPMAN